MNDPSATWDAVETADRIRRRDVSAREVIDAAIARAMTAASLGAVVTETFERARATHATGPLAGVPTFVKDLAEVEGVRTAWGSRAAGNHVSTRSEPSLARFFSTGLVMLGKSATPELGLTATTEPLGFPPTRNPWDPSRTVGGSSGGAAALVASGVVPIAHGSDGGGSIRIPASCAGLVGLKVTRRRFDMDASHLLPVNVAVQGVLTRTVRDTVAFFAALEGKRGAIVPIGELPRSERPLRIGLFVDAPLGTRVDHTCRDAAAHVGRLCESLGHHVDAIPCPFDGQVSEDFMRYWGMLGLVYVRAGKLFTHRGFDASQLDPWTVGMSRLFTRELRRSFVAIARLRAFGRKYADVMRSWDVLICPTLAEPPPPLGHLAPEVSFDVAYERLVGFAPFTPLQNLAGVPAISLPLAKSDDGLPIGVQLAGKTGDERTLLALSLALEEASPWERIAPSSRWEPARALL